MVVRAVLRLRAAREARSTKAPGDGDGWLVSPARVPAPVRGDDPLARVAALRIVAEQRPGEVAPRLDLGKALLECGRPHEATTVLAEAAKHGSAEARVQVELGRALGQLFRWDEALAVLALAVRLAPDEPEAHELRGEVLADKHWSGQDTLAPEAESAFREAIRLYGPRIEADPADAVARARRGSLLVGVGELQAGLAELRRAATERPADPEVQAALAGALSEANRHDEAARQYGVAAEAQRVLAAANPNHAGHQDRLGDLLNEAGADGDVDAWYEAALIDPEYPDLDVKLLEQGGEIESRFLEGARQMKAGDWEKAAGEFRAVVADTSVHAPALYGLGIALAREGRAAEAERALTAALSQRPDWPRAREALEALRASRA